MFTSNHTFVAFNEVVDRAHAQLTKRVGAAMGYSADVLVDRLVQRVVELALPPFACAVRSRLDRVQPPVPPDATVLDTAELKLTVGSGVVTVPLRRAARHHAQFVLHWGFCLSAILRGAFHRGSSVPAALVHDLSNSDVFQNGSDQSFLAFCRHGPVAPLREAPRLLIAATDRPGSSEPKTVEYCRHPLVRLTYEARIGWIRRARLLARHLALPLRYANAVASVPQLSLLGREIAYREIADALDRAGSMTAVLHTCSSYRSQPLWSRELRRARSHMVWYAQNWKPTRKSAGDVDADYPTTRWIRSDVHWVWTEAFARYLRSQVNTDVRAVGPLLWRLPKGNVSEPGDASILVFDVPAVSDQVMLELNGELTNYFTPDNVRAFIADIVGVTRELELELDQPMLLTLKMKRGYRPDYAREYFDYVDQLVADDAIELADSAENLFQIISRSRLVIAYPFTSPVYVAEFLNIPAIYYDPTGAIHAQTFADRPFSVGFVGSRPELHRIAAGALRRPESV